MKGEGMMQQKETQAVVLGGGYAGIMAAFSLTMVFSSQAAIRYLIETSLKLRTFWLDLALEECTKF
jgi:hypothetical protein